MISSRRPYLFTRSPTRLATEAALAVMALVGVTWCDWGSPKRVVRSLERLGMIPPWPDRLA